MGFIRFILALSVVYAHAYPIFGYRLLDGYLAVISFFVISGFYMTLVLNRKYIGKNSSYRLFITNRFLRIYPIYWIGFLALFLSTLAKHILYPGSDIIVEQFFQYYHDASLWQVIIGISNDFFRNITLIITTDYLYIDHSDPFSLFVKQAWTLQVELLFYLVAPFIVRRGLKQILLIISGLLFIQLLAAIFHSNALLTASLTGKVVFYMSFFLLGTVGYHIYLFLTKIRILKVLLKTLLILFILFVLIYKAIPITSSYFLSLPFNIVIFIAILTPLLPFIFLFSQKNKFDRWLGELSFPMYIIHSFIIKVLQSNQYLLDNPQLFTIILIILTIVSSWIMVKIVEIPIDKIRQKRLRHS